MFRFLNYRGSKAISAAVLSLNLGLGMLAPDFTRTAHAVETGAVDPSTEQGGELTDAALQTMLQSLNLNFTVIQNNGPTYVVNVPASNGNPAVSMYVAVSPNHKWINVYYIAVQYGTQDPPSAQSLLALMEANDQVSPCFFDIENNLLVLRLNLPNQAVSASELMDSLKMFYKAIGQTRSICTVPTPAPTPAPTPSSPNPFN